ncbi:hypothetical protein QBC39DRAFT_333713 [Podospora conica]|nr:hypothetical protein QBC39DRAFT_333713 [Schizothecium conicum]
MDSSGRRLTVCRCWGDKDEAMATGARRLGRRSETDETELGWRNARRGRDESFHRRAVCVSVLGAQILVLLLVYLLVCSVACHRAPRVLEVACAVWHRAPAVDLLVEDMKRASERPCAGRRGSRSSRGSHCREGIESLASGPESRAMTKASRRGK